MNYIVPKFYIDTLRKEITDVLIGFEKEIETDVCIVLLNDLEKSSTLNLSTDSFLIPKLYIDTLQESFLEQVLQSKEPVSTDARLLLLSGLKRDCVLQPTNILDQYDGLDCSHLHHPDEGKGCLYASVFLLLVLFGSVIYFFIPFPC